MTQLTQEQLNEKLFKASRLGSIDAVKEAIEQGADINARTEYGYTPLHFSAWQGITEMVKLLLEKGANVNVRNGYGDTPLHYADLYENTDIVELLEQHGAVS